MKNIFMYIFMIGVLILAFQYSHIQWNKNKELYKNYSNIRQLTTQIIIYSNNSIVVKQLSEKIMELSDPETLK